MAASSSTSAALGSRKVAYVNIPIKSSTTLKNGAHVCVDSSGYLVPASDTSGAFYVGRFADPDITTTGSDGDFTGKVTPRVVDRFQEFAATSAAASWVGKIVSFVNDYSVALAATNTNDIAAGRVLAVLSSTLVIVDTGDIAAPPVAA